MRTFLAIGDDTDFDSFQKFISQKRYFGNDHLQKTDYQSVLKEKLPEIKNKKIIVLFFFPFKYWNKYIETRKNGDIYGNKKYFDKFKRFWKKVNEKIMKKS